MGAMIYLALDKKSNFPTRLASLGALAVMIITVIICLFIILTDNTVPFDPSTLIVGAAVEEPEENHDMMAFILTIFFFLVLFLTIAFLALREHKKSITKKSSAPRSYK